MSSTVQPVVVATYLADGAISEGAVVKPGSDRKHVALSASNTSKNIGLAGNTVTTAEDAIEVVLLGGAKALLQGTTSAGDMLTANSDGTCLVTTTNADRVVAMALEDGVAGDIISALVVPVVL